MSKSSMKHEQSKPHRSTLQTIALIYVAIHSLIFWLTARSMPDAAEDSTLILSLFAIASLASIVAAIAMWFWKRWGIYLYVVATLVLATAVLLQTGSMIMLFGAILPMIIVLYIFSKSFKHFS